MQSFNSVYDLLKLVTAPETTYTRFPAWFSLVHRSQSSLSPRRRTMDTRRRLVSQMPEGAK